MRSGTPVFHASDGILRPDTCEPLREAHKFGHISLAAAGRAAYPGWKLPDDWVPEVRSVGVWDASTDQSWGLDWHRNEGLEITYLERGRAWFEVEGMGPGVFLKEGDLTITRPWQLHRVGKPFVTASRLHWLILDVGVRRPNKGWRWPSWLLYGPKDLHRLASLLRQNDRPVWRTNSDVRQTFQRLSEHLGRDDRDTHDTWLKLYVNAIMVAFGELMLSREVTLDPNLTASQRAVEMFLAELPTRLEEEWTVDRMAEECSLNRTRFSYYCKQATNKSPAQYLAACRVEAASELLRHSQQRSITDIALACGFGSSQYFATIFRDHTGTTPREFRAKADV